MTFLLVLVLAAAALSWWYANNPSRAERLRKKKEALAQCAEHGHVFGGVEHALDSWQFPFRRCSRCGHQEILDTCVVCGAKVNRNTREVVDDGRCEGK